MNIAKNIANTFLAITLLIATTGVTLHKHYCMGRLKAVAINEYAKNCGASGEKPMPCCEDVSQELKVEEITQTSFDFDSQPSLFQIAFIHFFISGENLPTENQKPFLEHSPPPIPDTDYQVDYQVFII